MATVRKLLRCSDVFMRLVLRVHCGSSCGGGAQVIAFAVDLAKRAFIKVLLQLAVTYAVKLSLSRDSPDDAVNAAYRKVSLKVHPDKGGTDDQQTALNAAREAWETAKVAAPGKGKKRKAAEAETPESSLQWVPVLPVRVMKYMAA